MLKTLTSFPNKFLKKENICFFGLKPKNGLIISHCYDFNTAIHKNVKFDFQRPVPMDEYNRDSPPTNIYVHRTYI